MNTPGAFRAAKRIGRDEMMGDFNAYKRWAEIIDQETSAEPLEVLEKIVNHPNFHGCIDPTGSGGRDLRIAAKNAIQKARGAQ